MTTREKRLATGLVAVLCLAGGALILYLFAVEPLKAASDRVQMVQGQLAEKQRELAREEAQIAAILKLDPRLAQWAEISLPPRDPKLKRGQVMTEEQKRKHINQLQVDYEKYLHELMRRNGFKADSIVITPRQVEKQSVARGKQPIYERLVFGVGAKGQLGSVSDMLQEFHQTPLLHQVRNLTVEVPGASLRSRGTSETKGKDDFDGVLDVKMTVEALMVTGAKDRETLLPSKLSYPVRVLAEPARSYNLMAKKNMYTGIKPPPPPPTPKRETPRETPRRPREDPTDVLRFVKLTMLCFDPERQRWEATVYDQAKGGSEKKLNTRALNELTVLDRYDEVALEATVVHIDERQLVFKVDGKYYRMRCGDFIYPAIREPLSAAELKELGISGK